MFDLDAAGFEDAIDAGRVEPAEAGRLCAVAGSVTEVVAWTDEGYDTWSI